MKAVPAAGEGGSGGPGFGGSHTRAYIIIQVYTHAYIIIIRVYIYSERSQIPIQGSAETVLLRSNSKMSLLTTRTLAGSVAWYNFSFR